MRDNVLRKMLVMFPELNYVASVEAPWFDLSPWGRRPDRELMWLLDEHRGRLDDNRGRRRKIT